jgi:hypothetical protein
MRIAVRLEDACNGRLNLIDDACIAPLRRLCHPWQDGKFFIDGLSYLANVQDSGAYFNNKTT